MKIETFPFRFPPHIWTIDHSAGGPPRATAPDLIPDPVDVKIRSFASLPVGWRYGEGGPVSMAVINSALGLRRFLSTHRASRISAVPGPGGEVVVAGGVGGHYLEMIAEADGTFTIVHDHAEADGIYEPDLSLAEAKRLALDVLRKAWIMSVGYIQTNTLANMADLPARHSETSVAAYHWSTAGALPQPARPFANTRESTISEPRPLASRQFSGGSPQAYYPSRTA